MSVSTHVQEGFLGIKWAELPPYSKHGHTLIGFCSGIHLSKDAQKSCPGILGRSWDQSGVRKQYNLPYINSQRLSL